MDEARHRVLIVDDHPLVREGLASLIDMEVDLCVCGQAADAAEALDGVSKLSPDIVIVDLVLKGVSGLELIEQIRQLRPDLPMLVLTMHGEAFYAERALRAGAHGFVTKDRKYEEVVAAIRRLLASGTYVSESQAQPLLLRMTTAAGQSRPFTEDVLTPREMEVLDGLGRGLSHVQIARRWRRSVRTVESHCANIRRKLRLESSRQLLQRAVQWVESLHRTDAR